MCLQRKTSKALIVFVVDCHPNMHLKCKFNEGDDGLETVSLWLYVVYNKDPLCLVTLDQPCFVAG